MEPIGSKHRLWVEKDLSWPAVWPWASYPTISSLSFSTCKMRTITAPASLDVSEAVLAEHLV